MNIIDNLEGENIDCEGKALLIGKEASVGASIHRQVGGVDNLRRRVLNITRLDEIRGCQSERLPTNLVRSTIEASLMVPIDLDGSTLDSSLNAEIFINVDYHIH